jgi:hypothetical protein
VAQPRIRSGSTRESGDGEEGGGCDVSLERWEMESVGEGKGQTSIISDETTWSSASRAGRESYPGMSSSGPSGWFGGSLDEVFMILAGGSPYNHSASCKSCSGWSGEIDRPEEDGDFPEILPEWG